MGDTATAKRELLDLIRACAEHDTDLHLRPDEVKLLDGALDDLQAENARLREDDPEEAT